MHHIHSPMFVGLSLLVAAAGSWTALDLFRRVRTHVGTGRTAWLITAAVAMGASIWSMHFVAMLGYDPGSPVSYDPGLTLLSFVLAVLATLAAFFLAQRGGGRPASLLGAGLVMGAGICLMHYVGMAALRTAVTLGYDPALVLLSLVVAVAASTAALFMARREESAARRAVAAVILGAAISGMHYTAMAALRLGAIERVQPLPGAPPDVLALAVTLTCMSLLFLVLLASLYDQRVNVMIALDGGRIGYWEAVGPPVSLHLSDRAKAMLGFGPTETVPYETMLGAIGEPCRGELDASIRGALADGTPFSQECAAGPTGGWIDVRARAVAQGARSRRLSGVILDITEQRQAQERLHLLAREVDHRANNLLTVVQGVVALSQGENAEALKTTITGRVQALAQAHKLLSGARWVGADLLSLVREELLPYELGEGGRITLPDNSVTLTPAEAQAVAMLVHELATNAAKYGALSVSSGRVAITWVTGEGGLTLVWSESGGPPAVKPRRRGFGLTIIERALSSLPGSESRIAWRREGLVCEISLRREGPAQEGPAAVEDAPIVAASSA